LKGLAGLLAHNSNRAAQGALYRRYGLLAINSDCLPACVARDGCQIWGHTLNMRRSSALDRSCRWIGADRDGVDLAGGSVLIVMVLNLPVLIVMVDRC